MLEPTIDPSDPAQATHILDELTQLDGAAREQAIARLVRSMGDKTAPTKTASSITDEAQLWLALAPGWTQPLAQAAGFPNAEAEVLHQMAQAGLAEQTNLLSDDADHPSEP